MSRELSWVPVPRPGAGTHVRFFAAVQQPLRAWLAAWADPQRRAASGRRLLKPSIALAVFVYVTWFRVHGIGSTFQLEGDQIRDWFFALGRAADLPLAGAPTLAGGRSFGPIYYWLLWISRVTIGPFVDNLPHAGGIGLSLVQSLADVALLAALWRRLQSVPLAIATVLLIATSPLEAAITATVWNPQVAIAFSKLTIALVLTDDGGRSRPRFLLTVATAWLALQGHMSGVVAVVPTIVWLTCRHLVRRRIAAAAWAAYDTVAVILMLQVPYFLHHVIYGAARGGGPTRAYGALQGLFDTGLWSKLADSAVVMGRDLTMILFDPWPPVWMAALFGLAALVLVWREARAGFEWLVVTVLPLALGLVVYAPMRDRLDYWYVALAPAAAIMMARALAASVVRPHWRTVLGGVALAAVLLAQPWRYHQSRLIGRDPEYGDLVKGSRQMLMAGVRPRAITTAFPLKPTTDPAFLFVVMGGRLDPAATVDAKILFGGGVLYRTVTR